MPGTRRVIRPRAPSLTPALTPSRCLARSGAQTVIKMLKTQEQEGLTLAPGPSTFILNLCRVEVSSGRLDSKLLLGTWIFIWLLIFLSPSWPVGRSTLGAELPV